MTGLALAIYGLASSRFGYAAVGGMLIVGSYALYRGKHGRTPPGGSLDRPDADGGDD